MKTIVLLAVVASLILGCKRGRRAQSPEDSIRAAIQSHLAQKGTLNVQAFDTDVKQVTIDGDRAQAQVEFRVKGGPGSMQLTYALEKHEGNWSVIESDPVGSNFSHPGLDQGQNSPRDSTPAASHSLADTLRSFGLGAPPPAPPLLPGHPAVTGVNGEAPAER